MIDQYPTPMEFPSWISEPMSVPGQLSLLDPEPEPEEDATPPHGIPRPIPQFPPDVEVRLHTTEELVAWGQTQLVESDEESDLVDAIRNELERRGVRLFGRWTR